MSDLFVGAVRFDLAPLKPIPALEALGILTEKLLPLVASAIEDLKGGEGDLFAKIAPAVAGLPRLYEIFLERCQVEWQGRMVPLKAFADAVFERKPTLLLGWLTECLRIEFSDFLSAEGQSTLAGAASSWTSLLMSVGQSGK